MPRRKSYAKCRECGATEDAGATISTRALCTSCAIGREATAIEQIARRQGEFHERWIAGMVRAAMKAADDHTPAPSGESGGTPANSPASA